MKNGEKLRVNIKVSQMFPMQKIVLYNILKLPENLMDRRCKILLTVTEESRREEATLGWGGGQKLRTCYLIIM